MSCHLAKIVEYPGEKVVSLSDLTDTGLENALYQARELVETIKEAIREMDDNDE